MQKLKWYLKFVRDVLLVERIQTHEFEAFCHDVERLVVSFGAHGHLIGADLEERNITSSTILLRTKKLHRTVLLDKPSSLV